MTEKDIKELIWATIHDWMDGSNQNLENVEEVNSRSGVNRDLNVDEGLLVDRVWVGIMNEIREKFE
jgi:hypothetical protein